VVTQRNAEWNGSRGAACEPKHETIRAGNVDCDDWEKSPDNRSPFAAFSDDVLADGAALYAGLALE